MLMPGSWPRTALKKWGMAASLDSLRQLAPLCRASCFVLRGPALLAKFLSVKYAGSSREDVNETSCIGSSTIRRLRELCHSAARLTWPRSRDVCWLGPHVVLDCLFTCSPTGAQDSKASPKPPVSCNRDQ